MVGWIGWENYGSHPLKKLKVLDEYLDGRGNERVVDCFPKLKKVELSIGFGRGWEGRVICCGRRRLKIMFENSKVKNSI